MYPGSRYIEFAKEDTDQSVGIRFEKQVVKNGSQLAVKTSSQQITYDQLNKTANQLARTIRQRSRNEKPVAILLEHDLPAIVAIFAALKAAKIFVLVDPALPDARISHLLNDAGANLILTNNQTSSVAQGFVSSSRTIVNMDGIDPFLAADDLCIAIAADSISYILYTSGSTGEPKGVIQTHRNDLHNIRHHTNSLFISDVDRITLLGSYGTGQGMQDIYCALLNGGTLYPWSMKVLGLNGLADWLVQEGITVYNSAATVFRHFVRNLSGDEQFPDLRIVRLGSEPVSWKDVELFKKHFPPNCVFVNALSCSEVKTFRQLIINKEVQMSGVVPVGYPVEDKEVLLLDDTGRNLGPNAIGEIAVRSRYLSPGYWQKPDFTRSAFEPDPQNPDVRMYRTGDLGRISPDGCLQHLGRKDFLLKIRGHRIQAEEVELALLLVPGISQAVVTAYKDADGDARLIAYVTSVTKEIPSVTQIRDSLKKRLAAQMVPSKFIFLENLPLNSNGKVNRQGLPTPEVNRPNLSTRFSAPTTTMESMLANIWSEALSINKVGTHDNFFDLGGDSIIAMKISATIGRVFPWNLTLAEFYDACTVAKEAQLLVQKAPNVGQAERIAALCLTMDDLSSAQVETMLAKERNAWRPEEEKPISPARVRVVAREAPILASIAQEPILMLDRLFPDLHQFNIPTAYRVRAPLNLALLKQSLTQLIERHEALRTVFPMEDGKHYQSILKSVSINLEVIDLHDLPGSERVANATEMSREETRRSFDLARGPLFRVKVFRLSDDDHILVVTMHHVISDSWSMMLLLRDLAELYSATVNGSQSRLPDLPIQYADFAAWQRMVLQEGSLDGQLSYWKRRLSEPLTPMKFPSGVLQNDEMSFFEAQKGISISGKLFQAVQTLARQERTTPFVVLLTVLNILLARYLGQEDIRVGTIVANRHRHEVENLIGLFANTVILRTRISEDLNFRKLAQLVREITVSAYSNQDVPFEVLLQTLEKENGIRGDMLSPVLFIFRGEPQPINLPDLMFSVLDEFQSPRAPEVALTMFDLVLSVKQRSGELTGFLMYKLFVFDERVVDGFIWNFKNLLERIVCEPTESVSALFSSIEI